VTVPRADGDALCSGVEHPVKARSTAPVATIAVMRRRHSERVATKPLDVLGTDARLAGRVPSKVPASNRLSYTTCCPFDFGAQSCLRVGWTPVTTDGCLL